MSGNPEFGACLTRLLVRRDLDPAALGSGEGGRLGLRAVLGGAAPGPALLSWLGPELRMRVPDLYVIAGLEVPQRLAPLEAPAGWEAARLAMHAGQLGQERVTGLLELARTLPQQDRAAPFPPPRDYERYPPGFGGVLMRMMAARNLDWLASAVVMAAMSAGRVYWSAATFGQVGRGHKEVTPAVLPVFAAALGLPAGDLAVLAGMNLPQGPGTSPTPSAGTVAELLWETRRLTAGQVKILRGQAKAMRPH